jgi:hypothetical protein
MRTLLTTGAIAVTAIATGCGGGGNGGTAEPSYPSPDQVASQIQAGLAPKLQLAEAATYPDAHVSNVAVVCSAGTLADPSAVGQYICTATFGINAPAEHLNSTSWSAGVQAIYDTSGTGSWSIVPGSVTGS